MRCKKCENGAANVRNATSASMPEAFLTWLLLSRNTRGRWRTFAVKTSHNKSSQLITLVASCRKSSSNSQSGIMEVYKNFMQSYVLSFLSSLGSERTRNYLLLCRSFLVALWTKKYKSKESWIYNGDLHIRNPSRLESGRSSTTTTTSTSPKRSSEY